MHERTCSDSTLDILGTSCGAALTSTPNLSVMGPVVSFLRHKKRVSTCARTTAPRVRHVRWCALDNIHPHTKFERDRPHHSGVHTFDTPKQTLLTLLTWHVPHARSSDRTLKIIPYAMPPTMNNNLISYSFRYVLKIARYHRARYNPHTNTHT